MSLSVKNIAEHASFQAFMNCYLREADQGHWSQANVWYQKLNNCSQKQPERERLWVVEVPLTHLEGKLAVEVSYKTNVGRHSFGDIWLQRNQGWQQETPLNAVFMLVREIYSALDADPIVVSRKERELVLRIIESEQIMARYITERHADPLLKSTRFIDAEQALLFGHWQHPTPKSRQGMVDYHHRLYAPEQKGEFMLHYFKVERSLVCQRSAISLSAEDIIQQSLAVEALALEDAEATDYVILPMHPIQAQWLLHQPHVMALISQHRIINCGLHGVSFTATSSVRSLYNPVIPWMYKFSLPIKITNSLRVNKRHELEAGVVMASLYHKTGFSSRYPSFQIVSDPAYITVDLPGYSESGFEVIIRDNPFQQGRDENTVTIAALTQDPLPGQQSLLHDIITTLVEKTAASLAQVSMKWFARYWDCAIDPMIRLYDEHGIALEAHQQNSVIALMDLYPDTYYFRDNQGFYLSTAYRTYLESLEPSSATVHDLYFDDQVIVDRFSYYLMVNHLFSIIGRFGADGLIDETTLLLFAQQRLMALKTSLTGAGYRFVDSLLSRDFIPSKANLLTRLHDIDELTVENEQAIYTQFSNPLAKASLTTEPKERQYAIA